MTPWPTFPGCVLHVQVPLAKNSSVLNFALQKKIEIRSQLRKCGFALQSPDSTFSTVAMIIPFYGMEENDTFTNTSSYLTLILSFFNKSTFLVRNCVHFSGHTGTANRLIKVREEKEGVLCGFPILSSFTKDNPPLAGHLDSQVFMFRHFLSNRKMPFGDFSSKIIVVFNKDTLRACLTNFSTNFESWWKLNGKKGGEEKNLLHYVQNENQKGKEIVRKIQRALWERKCLKKFSFQ